jgi:hypothetical protein
MKQKKSFPKPLAMSYLANGRGAVIEISTIEANKYLGYPSTYAKCLGHAEHLTDTSNLSESKAAAACAAHMEKMKEKELNELEGNRQMGYPGTVVNGPGGAMASDDCPCANKESDASVSQKETPAPEPAPPMKQGGPQSVVDYQRPDVFVQYTPEEQAEIKKNLEESEVKKKWWIEPDSETEARDYSKYLNPDIESFAKKSKKQWEKIDKKELDRDSKKEKVKHEKDAVKDDQSKINKLKKGKPSVKKSVEEHDLKKDQEFDEEDKVKYDKANLKRGYPSLGIPPMAKSNADEEAEAKKGNLPPWLKDKKELDKDSKKEKVEHEKDAVKDDKKQIKDLKKDEKEDKKSEKKDKESK